MTVNTNTPLAPGTTPLMQQYHSLKTQHPNELLLFHLGDFYELFGEDARRAAPVLGIALTHRQDVPMCGMPIHASDNYIAKLLKAGLRNRVRVADVALEELEVGAFEIGTVARVGEFVEHRYVLSGRSNTLREVRADEAGAAGDEDPHESSLARQSSRPSRQCGNRGVSGSSDRSTEYAGRGAGESSSAVVILRTLVERSLSAKIASANSAHVQSPPAATW